MTEIALRPEVPTSIEPAQRESPVGDLIEWASAAQHAYQIAQRLSETSFVPKVMQRRADEITGAILTGRELGLSPMSSLRSIDVIDGTPAMRAHALRGLVQHHGHEVWVEESTDHRAIVCGQRKASTHIERSTWTLDRAKKANLAHKKNWQTHPAAMLVARATAEVCRLIAADVLLGMPYATEELTDGTPDDTAPVAATEPAAKKRAGARRTDPAAVEPSLDAQPAPVAQPPAPVAAEPPLTPDPTDPTDPAGPAGPAQLAPDMITPAQTKKLHTAFGAAGITARPARLRFASDMTGRELGSSLELSKTEAAAVIDALESLSTVDGPAHPVERAGWPDDGDDPESPWANADRSSAVIDADPDDPWAGQPPRTVVDIEPGELL